MVEFLTPRKLITRVIICLVLLAAVMTVCTMAGTQHISLRRVFAGPAGQPGENIDYDIFVRYRLPRVCLAALAGAALACAGVVLQAILRNPLADPYILGISSGAGLGAILAVLSGVTWDFWAGSPITIFAFAGAILTVWLVWLIGYLAGGGTMTTLLLAGVVVNAFFSAVIMFLTSIINSQQLQSTTFWLMGNITEKDSSVLFLSAVLIIGGIAALFGISNRLNILSFGREQAQSLGVDAGRVRFIAFALAAFVTAVAVGLSGLIGFVGLIIPHAVRLVLGPDHRQLLPVSAITGAGFLVVADTIGRIILAPAQLPAGVITAIAGGPFFLILLARYSRKAGLLK
jgi:iron complex transport system permease protein